MTKLILKNDNVKFPERATIFSAGHDVFADRDYLIPQGTICEIELPFVLDIKEEERVFLFLRSSIGIKKNCRFVDEKGQIMPFVQLDNIKNNTIFLKNVGEEDFLLAKGVHYSQLVITNKINENRAFALEKVKNINPDTYVTKMNVIKRINEIQSLIADEEITIKANSSVLLASGYKAKIDEDTFLAGFVPITEERFIYSNGVVVGDADYYDNEDNEGMYLFKLENINDEDVILEKGTSIVDLISIPYYTIENSITNPTTTRKGGIGSTSQ